MALIDKPKHLIGVIPYSEDCEENEVKEVFAFEEDDVKEAILLLKKYIKVLKNEATKEGRKKENFEDRHWIHNEVVYCKVFLDKIDEIFGDFEK